MKMRRVILYKMKNKSETNESKNEVTKKKRKLLRQVDCDCKEQCGSRHTKNQPRPAFKMNAWWIYVGHDEYMSDK
jgi:hypothetical protein